MINKPPETQVYSLFIAVYNGIARFFLYVFLGEYTSSRKSRNLAIANYMKLLFTSPNFLTFKEPRNRFQGINSASLCSLADRYNKPYSYSVPRPRRSTEEKKELKWNGVSFNKYR